MNLIIHKINGKLIFPQSPIMLIKKANFVRNKDNEVINVNPYFKANAIFPPIVFFPKLIIIPKTRFYFDNLKNCYRIRIPSCSIEIYYLKIYENIILPNKKIKGELKTYDEDDYKAYLPCPKCGGNYYPTYITFRIYTTSACALSFDYETGDYSTDPEDDSFDEISDVFCEICDTEFIMQEIKHKNKLWFQYFNSLFKIDDIHNIITQINSV